MALRSRSCIGTIALAAMVAMGCSSDAMGPVDAPGPPNAPAPVIGSIGVELEDRTLSVNQTTQAHAIVIDEDGNPLPNDTVVFTSSDDDVLTVSSSGLVTAVAPGTARVVARVDDHAGEAKLFVRRAADPALIYDRVGDLPGDLLVERYVFYQDSTFELEVRTELDQENFSFPGWHSETGAVIAFDFSDNRGQWRATGTVRGDTLFVEYNEDMAFSGFKDGAYVRSSQGPLPPSADPSSPPPPNPGSARILISNGYDPAWSPDGTRIAFASTRDGARAIYVAHADGSDARRLTNGSWPAWSPDGRRIAFHREGDFAWGDGQVLVIDIDGSNETALIRGEFPAWSPDDAKIAFADGEGISVMNADGSGISRLLSGDFLPVTPSIPNGIGKPAWSPDGRSIAFEHVGDGDVTPAQIFVMNADGSLPRRLTPTRGIQYAESDPAWSPAGSRIVFWSYGYGIATVGANGGLFGSAPTTVYKDFPPVVYGARPAWSPAGSTIAFTVRDPEGGAAIWVVDSGE